MANYYGISRTSYFPVKDEEAFIAYCEKWKLIYDHKVDPKSDIKLFVIYDTNWCDDGQFAYLVDFDTLVHNGVEEDYYTENVIRELVLNHVADGWAIQYIQIGNEKVRYMDCLVVTMRRSSDGNIIEDSWSSWEVLDEAKQEARSCGFQVGDITY